VCHGTVCPSIIATVQFAKPPSAYIFARGADNAIWYRVAETDGLDASWKSAWRSLGGNFLSQPAATSIRNGRVDVFGIWADQTTRTKTFQNGVWDTEWTNLNGTSSSAPGVCSFAPDSLSVFVIGGQDAYNKYYTNFTWMPSVSGSWDRFGGWVSSLPIATCGFDKLELTVYGGTAGKGYSMYTKRWTPYTGWTVFQGSWGEYRGDPTAVFLNAGTTHYFGVGWDGAMWHNVWTSAGGYTNPESLGGAFESSPHAFSITSSRIDVLAVGTDDRLKHKALINGVWGTEWEDLGGFFNSAPTAMVTNNSTGAVSIFGLGPSANIIHGSWKIGTSYFWGQGSWYDDDGQISAHWYRQGPA
jgi:hypothetical protein